jgi:hypothetical protein
MIATLQIEKDNNDMYILRLVIIKDTDHYSNCIKADRSYDKILSFAKELRSLDRIPIEVINKTKEII